MTEPVHLTATQIDTLTAFVHEARSATSASDVYAVFEKLLRFATETVDMTDAFFGRHYAADRKTVTLAAYYSGKGIVSNVSDVGEVYYEGLFPTFLAWLREPTPPPRRTHVRDLPPDHPERVELEQWRIKSVLYTAVMVDGALWGFYELWDLRAHHAFTPEDIALTNQIAAVLSQIVQETPYDLDAHIASLSEFL